MIDIFIKSYRKDFALLKYCLQSIDKYVSGYNEIVIVIPSNDVYEFNKLNVQTKVRIVTVNEYGNGYLYQQWIKMSAYKYCTSKFILFIDSDCLFYKPIDLTTLAINDKPQILYTPYSKVGDAICWQAPTERFMNDKVSYEFMRRLPLMYHKETLSTIHSLEPNLEVIIMSSKAFSEFNVLGAWAYKHQQDMYSFDNTDNWQYQDAIVKQLWSHCIANKDALQRDEYRKAVSTINEVLGLNIESI